VPRLAIALLGATVAIACARGATSLFEPCAHTPPALLTTHLEPADLDDPVLSDATYDVDLPHGTVTLEHVADLRLGNGRIAAGNGYQASTGNGVTFVHVTGGTVVAPVTLALLHDPRSGTRVAFAEVSLEAGDPVRWEEENSLFIGTDGGDGGFVGGGTLPASPGRTEAASEAYLAVSARDPAHCAVRTSRKKGSAAVLFPTGVGDGGYPTLVGRDEFGDVVSIVSYTFLVPWALSGLPGTPPRLVAEETAKRR